MTKPPPPLVNYEEKDLTELASILSARAEGPNILTKAEFKPFEFLYQNHSEPKNEEEAASRDRKIGILTKEFMRAVDIYRPIHIVVSKTDQTVILRLPQLFVPIKSIEPTEQNVQLVIANHQAQKSEFPKIKSKAQNRMTAAFRKQQADPDHISSISTARAESKILVEEFRLQKGIVSEKAVAPVTESAASSIDSALSRAEIEDL